MHTITARCRDCGTRATLKITDADRRRLESQNGLVRFCGPCGMSTRWSPAVAGTLWEPLDDHDPRPAEKYEEVGPNVLLIDDDEAILQVFGKALMSAHCDVVTTKSAREAAMLLARGQFDVIVSDVRIPEYDGIQFFEFLEKHFPEHRDRVIFVTGDTSKQTLQFFQTHHARFLTKPFGVQQLLAMVKDCGAQTADCAG